MALMTSKIIPQYSILNNFLWNHCISYLFLIRKEGNKEHVMWINTCVSFFNYIIFAQWGMIICCLVFCFRQPISFIWKVLLHFILFARYKNNELLLSSIGWLKDFLVVIFFWIYFLLSFRVTASVSLRSM